MGTNSMGKGAATTPFQALGRAAKAWDGAPMHVKAMAGAYVGPMLEVMRAVCDHLERVELKNRDVSEKVDRVAMWVARVTTIDAQSCPAAKVFCQHTGCNYPEGECAGTCGWAPTTGKG